MAINISDAEWNKLKEAIDLLAGFRPLKGDKPGKAVTQKELKELNAVITRLQKIAAVIEKTTLTGMTATAAAGASPTGAEFNLLVNDVTAIHGAISTLFSSLAK